MKKIRLIIIAILAMLSGMLFIVFSFMYIKIIQEDSKSFLIINKEQISSIVEKISEEIPQKYTIEITTAGDCTLGTDVKYGYNNQFDWWFKNKANSDYSYFFAKVKYLFDNDDYSYVNLEGTLTTATKKTEKTYNFKGDPSYTKILTAGSIEGVNVANNHSNDYGEIGYNDTKKYLSEANIDYFGHDSVLIKEIKGQRIAFVGYTGVGLWVDKDNDMAKTVKKLKEEENVDLVIANFHWGMEYNHQMTDVQRKRAHLAIDSGADIVIGSHPHCLQGGEIYKGKYIIYSLGNFVFGGNSAPRQIGRECLIVKMFFDYTGNELENIRVKLIPCDISSISSRNNYQPIPVTGKTKTNYLNTVNKYSINFKYVED